MLNTERYTLYYHILFKLMEFFRNWMQERNIILKFVMGYARACVNYIL